MDNPPDHQPIEGPPDPELVAAMAARVVRRKEQDPSKRSGGRPKGSAKPPGSGRKAGTPNLWTPEYREHLNQRAKPFELLADICAGRTIGDGDTRRKPTLSERLRAAETLTRKLLPDLSAGRMDVTGNLSATVEATGSSAYSVAQRLAFLLMQGLEVEPEAGAAASGALVGRAGAAKVIAGDWSGETLASAPDRNDWAAGGMCISFAELLPGDRERWVIKDETGRVVGSGIGREHAEAVARRIGGPE